MFNQIFPPIQIYHSPWGLKMSLTPLQHMVPNHGRGAAEMPDEAFPCEHFKAKGENWHFPGSEL